MPRRSAAVFLNLNSFLSYGLSIAPSGSPEKKTAPFGPASHLASAPAAQDG
jgi:hypothetical protein